MWYNNEETQRAQLEQRLHNAHCENAERLLEEISWEVLDSCLTSLEARLAREEIIHLPGAKRIQWPGRYLEAMCRTMIARRGEQGQQLHLLDLG